MKCYLLILALLIATHGFGQSVLDRFVSREDDKLMAGKSEFRFISFNVPCLHYLEDYLPNEATHSHRLPNEFEITDAIKSVKQMGGQAIRIYTLSVRKKSDDPSIPRHVLAPNEFDEDAFRTLDKVLEVANAYGIRIIIPFVCNYNYWGGIEDYAAFRGKEKEEFWTDPQLISDFKATIKYILNRKNHYTGVRYKHDKAILAWETGNELNCPPEWTTEIAAYIKKTDRNHLVLDGWAWGVRKESLNDPNIDIVGRHLYPHCCKPPVGPDEPQPLLDQLRGDREISKNKKPLLIGEFGLVNATTIEKILDAVTEGGTSGALLWSLRYHNRDGGLYWHTEMEGFRSFHWPGFPSGSPSEETEILNLVREKAFQIQNRPIPRVPVPEPPTLLPISKVSAISWQGSAGAKSYDIERAESRKGAWTTVGQDITDDIAQYKPLFNDDTVKIGTSYYYRIKARNSAGVSLPSKVIGPVKVEHLAIVDEMQDYSMIDSKAGILSLEFKYGTAMAKEETYRLKGQKGSQVTYKVPGEMASFKVYTLFPDPISDFKFSVSSDGKKFIEVATTKKEYTYRWKPVVYQAADIPKDSKYFKIEFATEAQISRVEIAYGK